MAKDNFSIQSASTQGKLRYLIAECGTTQKESSVCLSTLVGKKLEIIHCFEYPTPKLTDAAISWRGDTLFLPANNGSPKSLFIICELGVGA